MEYLFKHLREWCDAADRPHAETDQIFSAGSLTVSRSGGKGVNVTFNPDSESDLMIAAATVAHYAQDGYDLRPFFRKVFDRIDPVDSCGELLGTYVPSAFYCLYSRKGEVGEFWISCNG